MPELPEVEMTRENLAVWMGTPRPVSLVIEDDALLHAEERSSIVTAFNHGQWRTLRRHGKLLLWEFSEGKTLAMHLRMTGKFVLRRKEDPEEKSRARIHLGDERYILFQDVRRFGKWWWGDTALVSKACGLDALGPDAWSHFPEAQWLRSKAQETRKSLKALLLDQSFVAGVGNIVATEGCFEAKISPFLAAKELHEEEWKRVRDGIHKTIEKTLHRDRGAEIAYQGEKNAPNPFLIYGRSHSPCPECGTLISTDRIGGRSAFWCSTCQPSAPR